MSNRVCITLFLCVLIESSTAQETSWAVTISARSGEYLDAVTALGVSETATDGYDGPPLDIPNMPPFSPPFIDVYIPHADWGNYAANYAVDFRSPETTSQEWVLHINGSDLIENIQLSIIDTAECRLWDLMYVSDAETVVIQADDTTIVVLDSSEDTQFSIIADFFGLPGDTNFDGSIDILDVVLIVNIIISNEGMNNCVNWAADLVDDDTIDILDIVTLVNLIMNRMTPNISNYSLENDSSVLISRTTN